MKLLSALLASALLIGASASSFAAPTKAPSAAVQSQIQSALKGVDLKNPAAVSKALAAIIAKYPKSAASIVGYTVGLIGNALIGQPGLAANVISNVVASAVQASPDQAGAIMSASINNLPSSLQAAVVPQLLSSSLAVIPNAGDRAAALNTVYVDYQGDNTVIGAADAAAAANNIKVDDSNGSARYVVDTQLADANFTGDQGISNQGSSFFSGASGGSGNPGNTGNSSDNNNDNPPAS